MPLDPTPAPLGLADYDAIAAAVMDTERGRWFLAEFAQRHWAAHTERMLQALARLERAVQLAQRPEPAPSAAAGPAEAARIGERLQAIVWYLRETGLDETVCDALDREARRILALAVPSSGPAAPPRQLPADLPPPVDPRRVQCLPLSERLAVFV